MRLKLRMKSKGNVILRVVVIKILLLDNVSPIKIEKQDSQKNLFNKLFRENSDGSKTHNSINYKNIPLNESKEDSISSVNNNRHLLISEKKFDQVLCPNCKMNITYTGNSKYIICNSPFCKGKNTNFCSNCSSIVIPVEKDKHFYDGERSTFCLKKLKPK